MNASTKFIRPALIIIAIALAVIAQWILLGQRNVTLSVALYLAAIGILVFALINGDEHEPLPPIPAPARRGQVSARYRWIAWLISLVCAVGAFNLNADPSFLVGGAVEYQFTLPGVIAWFASILLFLIAYWQPEKSAAEWRAIFRQRLDTWRAGVTLHVNATTLALIAILALGAVFYFYRIDATPAEMNSDHAEKLLDVNDILEGHAPVFFNRNTGREPLQFYVTTALIKLFGLPLSHFALKFGTALIGWLTIPWTFFLAREMFDDTVGLLAAFFAATLHWAVAIARMGLRYPYTPFFAAASLYFVWRAIKYHRRNDFLMAGFWLGFGLLGYIPSRNVPLIALGMFGLYFILADENRWRDWKAFALNVGVMLGMILVIFMPLLRFSLDFPDLFWYRALTRVASTERPIEGNVLAIFAQNLINLAEMFHYRGDEVWVTNVAGQPTLDFVSGGLLMLGVVIAIFYLFRKNAIVNTFLLATFVTLLLPSALALAFPRENPSLVRTGGAIPLTTILLALPLAVLARAGRQPARLVSALKFSVLGIVLAAVIALNYQWYFVQYDQNYRRSAQNSTEVAAVIRGFAHSIGDLQHAYYIGFPHWIDGRAIAINIGDIHWDNFSLNAEDFFRADADHNRLFIVHRNDRANLEKLRQHYPTGQIHRIPSQLPDKDFIAFLVPAHSAR